MAGLETQAALLSLAESQLALAALREVHRRIDALREQLGASMDTQRASLQPSLEQIAGPGSIRELQFGPIRA